MKSVVRSYNSFTNQFKNPYSFSTGRVNSDVSDLWLQRLQEAKQREQVKLQGRSGLDRTFDFLLAPLYGSAGFADGFVQQIKGQSDDPFVAWRQAGQGFLHGLNVFNNTPDEEHEYTYSKVLETAGWKPESTAGKIAKGTIGLGMDILLDPTTYLTGGASNLIKGTGRVGKTGDRVAQVANNLTDVTYRNTVDRLMTKGVSKERAERFAYKKMWENADKFKGATHMTEDMAKEIVERQMYDTGQRVTSDVLQRDSKKLADEYNRLLGIRDVDGKGKAITFGVENLPFGEHLAPKLGVLGKTIHISDGRKVREISDRLRISHAYSRLRDTIYGRKLGELFSTTAPLHRLATQEPSKLYDFIKFIEYTKGLNADKLKAEKEIRDYAKAMDFTPAEQKEIITLLEDKTIWGKVKDVLKFSETEKAKEIRASLQGALVKTEDEIDDLLGRKTIADQMRYASENELVTERELYRQMRDTYREDLTKIDVNMIQDKERKQRVVDALEQEAKLLDEELQSLRQTNFVDTKELDDLVKLADEQEKQYDDYMKLREHLKTLKKDTSSTPAEKSGQIVKDNKQVGESVESVDDVINKAVDEEVFKMGVEAPAKSTARYELINKLSKYIYGEEGKLLRSLRGDTLTNLINKIKKGESPDDLAKFIEENAHLYSEHATEVYKFLAKKYGYKSWDEAYKKPIKELEEKLRTEGDLAWYDYQKYIELKTLNAKRQGDIEKLFKRMSYNEFKEFRLNTTHNAWLKELESEIDLDLEKRRRTFADNDSAKDTMKYADQMEREIPKSTKEILTNDNYSDMFDDAIQHYINAQSKKAGKNLHDRRGQLLGEKGLDTVTRMTENMQSVLLENFKGKSYRDLTSGQKTYLMRMTMDKMYNKKAQASYAKQEVKMKEALVREAQRRDALARIEAITDTVKPGMEVTWKDAKRSRAGEVLDMQQTENGTLYKVRSRGEEYDVYARDVKHVRLLNKQRMSPRDLMLESKTAQNVIKEREELASKIQQARSELDELDGVYTEERKKLYDFFKVRADEQKKVITELEDKHLLWDNTYRSIVESDEAEKLYKQLDDLEKALENDDALETYVRLTHGDKAIEDALHDANVTHSARIALEDMTESERVKEWVETLFNQFKKIGEEEVMIGKLKREQFEEMLGRYVPHILTEDGRKYIDSLKELEPHKSSISRDLGYGLKWNPYAQSRTIEGKNIEEINDYFRDKLQGKNLFSDNISDIYITRALKHTELMYDNAYMNTMMDVFGRTMRPDDVIQDGYKAVVNYGQLKETIARLVRSQLDTVRRTQGVSGSEDLWNSLTKSTIQQLGLPPNILDDIATPMVELTQEQVARLAPHGVVKQVNDAIVMKANQARKLQIAKDQNRFLQMYDKFLHWTKLNQTTVMPSFHVRNKISNMYNNWLGVGRDAVNPRLQSDAWKTVWHLGDAEKIKNLRPLTDVNGNVYHWNDLYELAKQHNVIDEGFFAKDIGAGSATSGVLKKLPSKYDPTDTGNFILYKKGAEWGTRIENSDRLLHFASLLRQGKSVDEAARSSRQFLFDYSDLTAFEQNVMKRLMPYYTWLRKNGRLQVSQVVEQPGKYRDTAKVMEGISSMNNSDESVNDMYLSDFARDWVQTPFSSVQEGRNGEAVREPIMANPNMPFMDLGRLPNPFNMGTSEGLMDEVLGVMSQTAPAIKVPLELATNRNFFFNDEIVGEGDNQITPRLAHIMRQLALWNAGEGFFRKEGLDSGLHTLNTFTGLKGLSYDYETSKGMRIGEYLKRLEEEEE